MPPKKGGKKGKNKRDNLKKKDTTVESMTFSEAVMIYQLEMKQSQVRKLKEDLDECKVRNERQKQQNQYLKQEQNWHVKEVIDQAQEIELEAKNEMQIPFEDVNKALQKKLSTIRIEEDSVQEMRVSIQRIDDELELLVSQLEQLREYKDHGKSIDKAHVEVLVKEMEEMDNSYAELAGFFDKSLSTIKQTISRSNEENITVHKKLASEVVIKNLDKHTEQEFLDNEWLLKEVSIHRNHIVGVETEVEMLEKENIELMAYLFEQHVQDIKVTTKFNTACKEEEQNASQSSNEDDEIIELDDGIDAQSEMPDDLKWVDSYLKEFDVTNHEDDYKLGPVEVKLLYVVGTKKPVHDMSEMSPDCFSAPTRNGVHHNWVVEKEELVLT